MGAVHETGYVLKRMRPTTEAFDALMQESRREGYWMLVRLHDGWASGRNKFLKQPEMLLGVYDGRQLVGVGGLNIDPYFEGRIFGRVRHLYVGAAHRRLGVGRMLVSAIVERARAHFSALNTRAPAESFAFYERLGFLRVSGEEFVTHRMLLTDATAKTGKAN
ncbi:MAG: GNAT family N-acetyltransferase [Mesorhizobium sp.]|nr:GNAT family N-acetyltransferase [bacterium M00.F.Ca.ET.205.01.1.1]TGU55395.1 GNAT family N-acetyltransferase [bacterium M00.F.Ca.ET.152.01.1.1]TGV40316.1 GNAT family N-acetyltransferase [Mesorhizobium sp. M00.F.Ca.ET.186.01.1.1]TGZ45311.1 GNAT family N-acetyltransferase [bacterium M00.F.Ca.ET.162.01.1.1]TIW61532.1 MAG: GNAT family N-acetyltransferase [Mesorhizobium sp.]